MKTTIQRALTLTGFMLAAGLPAAASAQQFQVEQFEPLHGQGVNILNISRSETLGHLTPSAGLFVHFQDDPFQLETERSGDVRARLVDEQLKVELIGGIGLFDFLEIGLALPVVLLQSGEGSTLAGVDSFSGVAAGDVRLIPKVQILDPANFGGLGLGLLLPVWLPTGGSTSFNSDGSVRVEPRLALDWNSDVITIAANAGVHLRPKHQVLNYTSGPSFRYGLGASVPVIDPLTVIASYYGSVGMTKGRDPLDLAESAGNSKAQPMELMGGVQLDLPMSLVAQAGAGVGLTSSVGTPDFRLFASIGYTPRGTDSDNDGVRDSRDECPADPEDRDRFEDSDGCPDPDNDGDGLLDVDDKCPKDPEDFDQFEDTDGCPDLDNDQDKVLDADDQCPNVAAAPPTGCPPVDSDNDGVMDGADRCPNDPEDKDGFEDADGCPDPDNDADGVLDAVDKCPTEKEIINGVEDEDGCPDQGESKVRITASKIEILEKVYFDTNKATIKSRSFNVLSQVALILKANQQVTKVRVEGHTDDQGDAGYNRDLSQRRADAVRDYLVGKGVNSNRLESVGFGEERPVEDNRTRAGREANRRVEFNLVESTGNQVRDGTP